MLEITIPEKEVFDETKMEFLKIPEICFHIEHSLKSISEWESRWHKPFLNQREDNKSFEEVIDYIYCMTLEKEIDPSVFRFMPQECFENISKYLEDSMTATFFRELEEENRKTKVSETITAEIVYYWMVTLGIPKEFENWHFNRLITLIKVIAVKNQTKNKMDPKKAAMERNRINEMRRAKYRTRG